MCIPVTTRQRLSNAYGSVVCVPKPPPRAVSRTPPRVHQKRATELMNLSPLSLPPIGLNARQDMSSESKSAPASPMRSIRSLASITPAKKSSRGHRRCTSLHCLRDLQSRKSRIVHRSLALQQHDQEMAKDVLSMPAPVPAVCDSQWDIRAVWRFMDSDRLGHVSVQQVKNSMKTLGFQHDVIDTLVLSLQHALNGSDCLSFPVFKTLVQNRIVKRLEARKKLKNRLARQSCRTQRKFLRQAKMSLSPIRR